jgi:hypothetical protein
METRQNKIITNKAAHTYKPSKPWRLDNSISNILAVEKSAIAISTMVVAPLNIHILYRCRNGWLHRRKRKGGLLVDFGKLQVKLTALDSSKLVPSTENNDDKEELVPTARGRQLSLTTIP